MSSGAELSYAEAIRDGFEYLLRNHEDVFVVGQGLWSPWYVGNSMTELEVRFGKERVIDTPVSEQATTGLGVGAAIAGKRPIVVHPRMDFMLLAVDQMVTQAAKWSSMFGGRSRVPLVVRGIINRGGEQGAQHSQALHAWFAHIPGLRVVMPFTVADARDLLVSATLIDDPVLYIDDRWLYESRAAIPREPDLTAVLRGPAILRNGSDVTVVGIGFTTSLALEASVQLEAHGISAEVIDLRVLNPLDTAPIKSSVERTGRLVVVDGGWSSCGMAAELIASVSEAILPLDWQLPPEESPCKTRRRPRAAPSNSATILPFRTSSRPRLP